MRSKVNVLLFCYWFELSSFLCRLTWLIYNARAELGSDALGMNEEARSEPKPFLCMYVLDIDGTFP